MRDVRDEHELVRRCREGSEAAYAELVRRHRPRLYLLAYRLTGQREAAEDVVQETFLAAFRQIEKVDPRPSLSPWLNTIVLRTAGRAASRARTRAHASLDQATQRLDLNGHAMSHAIADSLIDADPGADPHEAAEAAELRRALTAAMLALPFKYRAAVVLRHVMGFDYAEAARELDLPLNTFKSHLLRGTKLLREALAHRLQAEPVATSSTIRVESDVTGGNGRHAGDLRVGAEQSLRR